MQEAEAHTRCRGRNCPEHENVFEKEILWEPTLGCKKGRWKESWGNVKLSRMLLRGREREHWWKTDQWKSATGWKMDY